MKRGPVAHSPVATDRTSCAWLAASVMILSALTACSPGSGGGSVPPGAPPEAAVAPHRVDHPTLQNLLQVSRTIWSGGEPHGEDAFAALSQLGVKTIVSVDGAKPDVETARQHGLRYVHIPIGYDGVGEEPGRSLARLIREAEGPFYVHCHHGRHRGPAAAAVACIAAGEASNAQARKILELAGTSKDYAGLWRDVASYRSPPADAELPELVEVAQVSSFAAAMALLDRAHDNLKLCRDAGWTTPADHPDLVPAQEALILREGFHESGRTLAGDADARLRAWLTEAETSARALQAALGSGDAEGAGKEFDAVVKSCSRCHAEYRD